MKFHFYFHFTRTEIAFSPHSFEPALPLTNAAQRRLPMTDSSAQKSCIAQPMSIFFQSIVVVSLSKSLSSIYTPGFLFLTTFRLIPQWTRPRPPPHGRKPHQLFLGSSLTKPKSCKKIFDRKITKLKFHVNLRHRLVPCHTNEWLVRISSDGYFRFFVNEYLFSVCTVCVARGWAYKWADWHNVAIDGRDRAWDEWQNMFFFSVFLSYFLYCWHSCDCRMFHARI